MYRILFLGSGELARGVLLGLLHSEHQVVGVLPWQKAHCTGWASRLKRVLMPDALALFKRHQLPVLHAERANTEAFLQEVAELQPDILLVAGWGEILKPEVLALAKVASVNVHPSLLPYHRGSNPVSSVLCAGEQQTGVTYHYLNAKVDAGDILLQSAIDISLTETSDSLGRKIGFLARQTVVAALSNIELPGFRAQPQNESSAHYAAKLPPGEEPIDWSSSALDLHNKIRGFNPWRQLFTRHRKTKLYVLSSEIVPLYQPAQEPGKVLHTSGSQLVVATGDAHHGLLLNGLSCTKKMGVFYAKVYVAKSVKAGDFLL